MNAAFFMDMVYNSTHGPNTYYGLNVHCFVSNTSGFLHELSDDNTEYIDAITLNIYPALIITVSTQFEYVISDDNSTVVLYSKNKMTSSLIASIFVVSYASNEFLGNNFLSNTLLENLNLQNISSPVNWRNSSSIILRKNLYPNYNFCYMQLQTYDVINTISLKHPDIQHMTFYNNSLFQYIFNMAETHVIFYTNVSSVKNLYTISNQFHILSLPYNTSVTYTALGATQNVCSFSDIINSNSCYNDDSTVSSENITCSMIPVNLLLSYCNGTFDTVSFNASQQCCVCNGGYDTHKNMIQTNNADLRNTNVVYLEQMIDEVVSVNSTDLYLVEMETNFPMDCVHFTSSVSNVLGATYENVFKSSLGLIFDYTQKLNATESSRCYSKITSRFYDIQNAMNIYNLLKRLMRIHENQSIPIINIHAVPYHNYIVDVNSINVEYSQRLQNTSCVAEMDVNATAL